jgi:hypothetical protein
LDFYWYANSQLPAPDTRKSRKGAHSKSHDGLSP